MKENYKIYKIVVEDLKQITDLKGTCIASDMITVDGKEVRYMYREEPIKDSDSGWRFFSGEESQEYADNENNFSYYNINTIANYDPLILDYLEAEIGTSFEREEGETEFFRIEYE